MLVNYEIFLLDYSDQCFLLPEKVVETKRIFYSTTLFSQSLHLVDQAAWLWAKQTKWQNLKTLSLFIHYYTTSSTKSYFLLKISTLLFDNFLEICLHKLLYFLVNFADTIKK